MLKIFLLSADPKENSKLNVDVELNQIKEVRQSSDYRDNFEIEQTTATNYDNLLRVLMRNEPSIIHFSGHGVGEEGLVLVDQNGKKNILKTETLTTLISILQKKSKHIKCVFLNGCYTEIQAEAISPYVEYVIGMNDPIFDNDAVKFAKYFYMALFANRSIEESFQIGCVFIGHSESSISIVDYDENTKRAVYDPAPKDKEVSQHIVNDKIPQLIINKKFNEPKQSATQSTQSTQIQLKTDKADFTELDRYLAQGEWKKADEETFRLMIQLGDKYNKGFLDSKGYLDSDDCKNFPREELHIIDQLWLKYSDNKFGFSIQKQIYLEVGGKLDGYDRNSYEKMGDRLGWRKNNQWRLYSDLTFNKETAPKGHLPLGWQWGDKGYAPINSIFDFGWHSNLSISFLFSKL